MARAFKCLDDSYKLDEFPFSQFSYFTDWLDFKKEINRPKTWVKWQPFWGYTKKIFIAWVLVYSGSATE
jgi:hypothetical protein